MSGKVGINSAVWCVDGLSTAVCGGFGEVYGQRGM
jgi:hypothetical protein